jgi:hypothetical protein
MKKNTFEKLIKEKAGALGKLTADDIEKMATSIEKLSASFDKLEDSGIFEEEVEDITESNNLLIDILIEAENPRINKKDLLSRISSQ